MWLFKVLAVIFLLNRIKCTIYNKTNSSSSTDLYNNLNDYYRRQLEEQQHQIQPQQRHQKNLTFNGDNNNINNIININRNECDSENINLFKKSHSIINNNQYLISSSVIYGLLTLSTPDNLNELCYNEMQLILDGIQRKEIWAMKVLDSSGTSQPGFLWGNNFWMGSIKGCEAANEPIPVTISNRYRRNMKSNLIYAKTPFNVNYRIIYAKHVSPWQIQVEFFLSWKILHIGLCVPKSCTDSEIHNLTQSYLDSNLLDSHRIFEQESQIVGVKNLEMKSNFFRKTSVQIVGLVTLLTLFLGLLAYIHESNVNKTIKINKTCEVNDVNHAGETVDKNGVELQQKQIFSNHIKDDNNNNNNCALKESNIEQSSELYNCYVKIIKCFSINDNLHQIFKIENNTNPDAIPIISGFKSISCVLILIFHMQWYMNYTVQNSSMVFAYGEQILWAWVGTNPILVDLFFTISGLLLSYNFLKSQKKIEEVKNNNLWQNIKLYGKQLLHRYLRLSPVYLIIVGLTEISVSYLIETSPFYVVERYDKLCRQYWWRNVLYIQNIFNVQDLCANWTWSMACEMQFFIIFTILLFIYAKNRAKAKTIFLTSLIGFTILGLILTFKFQFTPAFDVMHNLGNEIYIAPWSRIIPYMVGVGAGYLLHVSKRKMKLNKKVKRLLWTISVTVMIMTHYSTYDRGVSYYIAAPLMVSIRVLYSSSIAWMILACSMGHAQWLVRLMNHQIFLHVNKLAYTIYLINPLFILLIYGLKDHSVHVEPLSIAISTFGVILIVYFLSIMFTILFEIPYIKLSNEILRYKHKKS